jgi:REP element-mobilizing transposase RayT
MSGSTSSFLLYHLIFSTKNRARTLHPAKRPALFAYMGGIIKKSSGMPVLINGVWDHVHILAFLPRHISLSQSVQAIKGGSAHWFNQQDENHVHKLNWQEGYQIYTVSGSQLEQTKNYIFNQEEHHRETSFEDEMKRFEDKAGSYLRPETWAKYPDSAE